MSLSLPDDNSQTLSPLVAVTPLLENLAQITEAAPGWLPLNGTVARGPWPEFRGRLW